LNAKRNIGLGDHTHHPARIVRNGDVSDSGFLHEFQNTILALIRRARDDGFRPDRGGHEIDPFAD
jgi:hypothetical protein